MKIGNIINYDTGNARGLSTVVFVSGCEHHCSECHNPETWDYEYGEELYPHNILKIVNSLNNKHIKNLVISGGDPLSPKNIEGTLLILVGTKGMREKYKQKLIIYTGYTFEQLCERAKDDINLETIMNEATYIIDGRYNKDLKTKVLDYRGSINQRCWHRHELGYGDIGWMDISDYYFKEGSKYNEGEMEL